MEKSLWKNNLRALRKERGLTQQQVARLIGHASNDRISHWEKGQKVPSLKNLIKLSSILQVEIKDLL